MASESVSSLESFRILGRPGEENTAQAKVIRFSVFSRAVSATLTLLLSLLLTALVLPIPGLHLILPPIFFFGGIALAAKKFLKKGLIIESRFRCPQCGAEFSLDKESLNMPRYHTCGGCGQQLYLDLAHGR